MAPLYTFPRETQDSRESDELVDLYLGNVSQSQQTKAKRAPTYNTDFLTDKPQFPAGPDYDEARTASVFAKLIQDNEAEVRCVACQRAIRVANRLQSASI